MKKTHCLCAVLLPVFVICGCQHMNNADKGTLAGGALGATTGAIIGSATKHTGAGALIGGAVGAVAGGLTGNAIDQSERKTQAQIAAVAAEQQAQASQLGVTDVASMAQQHISDSVIIQQIRTTGSVYQLSPSDIHWLKSNGVSDAVVIEMQATASRPVKRVYSPTPVYVVEPAPPPIGIGVGFGYGGGRCRRW